MSATHDLFHALFDAITKLKSNNADLLASILPTHTPKDGQQKEYTAKLHAETDAVVNAAQAHLEALDKANEWETFLPPGGGLAHAVDTNPAETPATPPPEVAPVEAPDGHDMQTVENPTEFVYPVQPEQSSATEPGVLAPQTTTEPEASPS